MNAVSLENRIIDFIKNYVKKYPEEYDVPELWNVPAVGFAAAYDPNIQNLPQIVTKGHKLPQDFMQAPTVVISYFLPFKEDVARSNFDTGDHLASLGWAEAYAVTNTMIGRLNQSLAKKICEWGYRAAVPENIEMLPNLLVSNWSQRHLAYAAGLGTFGINNMLITEKGCCGRYGSIVADIPVHTTRALEHENCLYKKQGVCQKCVKNCFSGALTVQGFNREKCYSACKQNLERCGTDVCGKCDVDIPCAFAVPQ